MSHVCRCPINSGSVLTWIIPLSNPVLSDIHLSFLYQRGSYNPTVFVPSRLMKITQYAMISVYNFSQSPAVGANVTNLSKLLKYI